MEEIAGMIDSIIYSNEDTGFTVAKLLQPNQKETHCIVGCLPGVQSGETITCKGSWKRHPQYGKQFDIQSFEIRRPTDLKGIEKYLASGLIRGIGPVYAKKIVEYFGINTLEVLDQTPYSLLNIPGIGEKRIQKISQHWNEQTEIREVMIFLRSHEVKPSLARKIFKKYGKDSIKILQKNPYQIAKEIAGIGFKSVDQIAHNLGISGDSPCRIDSAISHTLKEINLQGHVCYPKDLLLTAVEKLTSVSASKIEERLLHLIEQKLVIAETIEQPLIWSHSLYRLEQGIVEELVRIRGGISNIRAIDIPKALYWIQKKQGIQFAEAQKEAIQASLSEKIHIITGGPGTGKSTITRAILTIAEKLTTKIILAAPTGRAAKRLTEITWKKAFTIHSLLEFDFTNGGFKKNRTNPIFCDLIIIDESSMIDTSLLYYLLRALPDSAKVIFIGDVDQLPSVGPGKILQDIIECKKFSITKLTAIFRQSENSRIVTNAHSIKEGIFPDLSWKENSDFYFYPVDEPERILGEVIYQMTEFVPKKFFLDPKRDIQLLSPMKKGLLGVENFNHLLQQKLNPSSSPLQIMGRSFHQGDKVMQLRNNYNKKVYNGDIGTIQSIDREEQTLSIQFDVLSVSYDFSELDEIYLAYAVSIHKYQGSECPCVIIPIHMSHYMLLFKNLIYTAITRGKRQVIIIGSKRALAIAIKKNDSIMRYTGLKKFLQN